MYSGQHYSPLGQLNDCNSLINFLAGNVWEEPRQQNWSPSSKASTQYGKGSIKVRASLRIYCPKLPRELPSRQKRCSTRQTSLEGLAYIYLGPIYLYAHTKRSQNRARDSSRGTRPRFLSQSHQLHRAVRLICV